MSSSTNTTARAPVAGASAPRICPRQPPRAASEETHSAWNGGTHHAPNVFFAAENDDYPFRFHARGCMYIRRDIYSIFRAAVVGNQHLQIAIPEDVPQQPWKPLTGGQQENAE